MTKVQSMFLKKWGILFLTLWLLGSGCDQENVNYLAGKDNLVVSFDIPAGLNSLETHYFKIQDVDLFFEETINANNLNAEKSYKIAGSKGRLISRLGQVDFSTIAEVTVDAVSTEDPTQRVEIFYQNQIPFTIGSELKLFTANSQIQDLLNDDKINLEIGFRLRSFTSVPIKLDLEFGYVIFE